MSLEEPDPAPEWNKSEENIGVEDTSVDIEWSDLFDDLRESIKYDNYQHEDPDAPEPDVAQGKSLQDYLYNQLQLTHFSEIERTIGELIIGNLNDDGQLKLKLFSLPLEYLTDFQNGNLSQELQTIITNHFSKLNEFGNRTKKDQEESSFDVKPFPLDPEKSEPNSETNTWKIIDQIANKTYTVKHEGNELNVYQLTLEDIASQSGCSVIDVESVLHTIQNTFEPTGIAYRDLQETLSIQIQHHESQHYKQNGATPYSEDIPIELAKKIVKDHLPDLLNSRIAAICDSLNVDKEEIIKASNLIGTLSPYPGRYFTDPSVKDLVKSPETVQGITPDVQIVKINEDYYILPYDNYIPRLRMNPYYINLMRDNGKNLDVETQKWIQKKYNDATDLMNSITQRGRTIERVTEAIFTIQSDFLTDGPQSIKPLTLKTIADMAGVHESTVSRVTSNKYVQTPLGTYPLKFFFSNQLTTTHGDTVSAEKVKVEIKEMINKEDSTKPLSDQAISSALKDRGIVVARRTVQKYREELGILSSRQRKNQNITT